MNKKELRFILEEGEGLKIEFKESLSNIDKEMVAFANTEGGRIFLGVSGDNKIKGIKINNKLKSQIQDIANNCDPSIKVSIKEFGNILIINVEEGRNKPYKCSSGFYIRQGPNSQKMKTKDIKEMILDQGDVKFDQLSSKDFNFRDFDDESFSDYLKRAGLDVNTNKKDALFNLGVFDEGKLNNTGILFFSKNPKKYFINGYVTCARYKGIDKVKVIDRKDIEAGIVKQLEESIKFIERNTKLEYEIKGLVRKEIPEYPIEALREAIINALMHRDYFERGANVQIDIFDDRITITNIGGLIKPLTKEKLGKIAVRRNPLIADLLHRINLVEKMGTGIRRMKDECVKHGKVRFEMETNGYFITTFRLRVTEKVPERVTEKVPERVTENQIKILNELKKNQYATTKDLSLVVSISERKIKENVRKLKQKGLLKRIGPDKGGHWEVKNV